MPRKGNELPRTQDDLDAPPPSTPLDWEGGAMRVSTFCSEYDASRSMAFELMKRGDLIWGRMGRDRRISRRSAAEHFANQSGAS